MVGRDKVYWPNVTSAKIFKLLRERTDPDGNATIVVYWGQLVGFVCKVV